MKYQIANYLIDTARYRISSGDAAIPVEPKVSGVSQSRLFLGHSDGAAQLDLHQFVAHVKSMK